MMRILAAAALLGLLASGADKTEWRGSASDAKVSLDARLFIDKDEMKKVLGHDPGPSIVIVQITVTPAPGTTLKLDRDDFLLRSDRDGQRSRPLDPAQIAGSAVLVISSRGGTQGTGMAEERRVPWGVPGIPGGSPTGGPPRGLPMPGQSPNVGTATADTSEAVASVEETAKKSNPLLDALKEKLLPDGELDKPASGLLYFLIEGKLRAKDLELVYRKAPPRLSVRFKDPTKK
ncbi:MAG: hypothetical protein ACOYX1_18915 [Acidobacteriota bacterium]